MSDTIVLRLSRLDVGQVLDGLDQRFRVWEDTANYLENGSIPEGTIEECSSAEEAFGIAEHYQDIINKITAQMLGQRG